MYNYCDQARNYMSLSPIKTALEAAYLSQAAHAKGYSPLHFAVLENNPDVVEKLLERGADPSQVDSEGLSAIDHAAYQKNPKILSLLVLAKMKQEGTNLNVDGPTVESKTLHYKSKAEKKDPLQMDPIQKGIAIFTCVSALVPLLASYAWDSKLAHEFLVNTVGAGLQILQLTNFLTESDMNRITTAVISGLAGVVSHYYPTMNLLLQSFLTGYLARSAFQAMKTSWKHIRYRTWDSICYAGVHAVNFGGSCFSLFLQARNYLSSLPVSSKKPEETASDKQRSQNKESAHNSENASNSQSHQKGTSTHSSEKPDPTQKEPVLQLKGAFCDNSTIQAIAKLDPKNVENAQRILANSTFDTNRYFENRKRYLHELRAKQRTKVHPDSCPRSLNDPATRAFQNVEQAYTTLDSIDAEKKIRESAPLNNEAFFTAEDEEFIQFFKGKKQQLATLSKKLATPDIFDLKVEETAKQLDILKEEVKHIQSTFYSLLKAKHFKPSYSHNGEDCLSSKDAEYIQRGKRTKEKQKEIDSQIKDKNYILLATRDPKTREEIEKDKDSLLAEWMYLRTMNHVDTELGDHIGSLGLKSC